MNKSNKNLLSWCTLPILGLVITACYLMGATWLLFDRAEQLETMPLNEIGDFLAGIFGALAFFWLVIGYFMQNSELKLNRKSLEKQIEEFEKSVETQKNALKFNIEQEKLREKRRLFLAQSNFNFEDMTYTEHHDESNSVDDNPIDWLTLNFKIKNLGLKIFNVKFTLLDLDENPLSTKALYSLEKYEVTEINFNEEIIPLNTKLLIQYTDSLSNENHKKYEVMAYCLPEDGPDIYGEYSWEQHAVYYVSVEEIAEGK